MTLGLPGRLPTLPMTVPQLGQAVSPERPFAGFRVSAFFIFVLTGMGGHLPTKGFDVVRQPR